MTPLTDTIIYWVCVCTLILFIAWLLFIPAPGHEPLIGLHHVGLVA